MKDAKGRYKSNFEEREQCKGHDKSIILKLNNNCYLQRD